MSIDWAVVEREVALTLRRRRRVCSDSAAEITQTALERTVVAATPRWSTRDAVRWSVRVAINLAIDASRRMAATPVEDVPEQPFGEDVEAVVLDRLEVERVARALGELSPRDRELLLEHEPARPVDDRARTRLKVARYRARAKLRRLLDSAGAWIGSRPGTQRVGQLLNDPAVARAVVVAVYVAGAGAHPMPHPTTEPLQPVAVVGFADPGESMAVLVTSPAPATARRQEPATAGPPAEHRPGWSERGNGPVVVDLGRPTDTNGDGRGDGLWWWEDDPEEDDEPLLCVWSKPVDTEVCTDVTWGDARRASPVPLPSVPT